MSGLLYTPNTWISLAAARSPIICSSSGVHAREASATLEPLFITLPAHPPNCACAEAARRTRARVEIKCFFMSFSLLGFQFAVIDEDFRFVRVGLHAGHELSDALVFSGGRLAELGGIHLAIGADTLEAQGSGVFRLLGAFCGDGAAETGVIRLLLVFFLVLVGALIFIGLGRLLFLGLVAVPLRGSSHSHRESCS